MLLTDNDKGMAQAFQVTFEQYGTIHRLCLWHLLKNVMKNLCSKLGNSWKSFLKMFYECLNELDENDFLQKWSSLSTQFPDSAWYLKSMDTIKEKWASCYNKKIFMADMTTTQRGESMNNLIKSYMDASTSLSAFLIAFKSALEIRKESTEFAKYREIGFNYCSTKSPYEKQASELLTKYALTKTQKQLSQCMSYKSEKINR